ncbi:hypothetical protein CQW23_30842 [Capsicum baccatum]|uniref:Calpain-type cysteine protease DEK1 n=1 Tax=Capsicum baccatum TaxID=33114 RepID=A0A2G2V985_CAPBA|nr:hypothetical protein CQW23_30842 [Capsicum baccatum]
MTAAVRAVGGHSTGLAGAVCILDDEPTTSGRQCGQIDPTKNICWEFLVAGSEQGIEAGQVRLRLITKTDKQTTVKEWSISATSIADGRWHIITLTIDANWVKQLATWMEILMAARRVYHLEWLVAYGSWERMCG